MVAATGGLLAGFLAYVGARYGFKWLGLAKTFACGILLMACLTYGVMRGDKDIKLIRQMPSSNNQVGIAHAGLIMLFVLAGAALAFWIVEGPP